jgi:AraC-like DNA-binding protein
MFFQRGVTNIGRASITAHIAVTRELYTFSTERRGVCFDTRFIPGVDAPERPHVSLWLILHGTVRCWNDPVRDITGPAMLAMPESHFEGVAARRLSHFHACGDPFVAVDLRARSQWVRELPRGVVERTCSEPVVAALRTFCDVVLRPADDAAAGTALRGLVDALERDGTFLPGIGAALAGPSDRAIERLERVVGAAFEKLDSGLVSKSLAGQMGLSARQFFRLVDVMRTTQMTPPGQWRQLISQVRSKLAAMLLSAPDLSMYEIARAVGYTRPEAMANAFQKSGLPPPRVVRQQLLAVHGAQPPSGEPGADVNNS